MAEELVPNPHECLEALSQRYPGAVIAMETGTHSPWISRLFQARSHRVIVANARKLPAIAQSHTKSEVEDARLLAWSCRAGPRLLSLARHVAKRANRSQHSVSVSRSPGGLPRPAFHARPACPARLERLGKPS